jgi:hypothetical protein
MAGRMILWAVILGIVGLVVGYLIFGRIAGDYVPVGQLLQPAKNVLEDLAQSLTGVQSARRSVLISGAVGAAVGLIVGAVGRRRRA